MARKPLIGRSIGSLLPQVTQKALEKYGFPAAAVLTDWPQIVGPELASYTAPERLRWPKGQDLQGDDGATSAEGATLVLRVEGPRALEVQHMIGQLIERINAHFGFLAVTEIRILQAPIVRSRGTPLRKTPQPTPRVPIAATEVPDERLRQALERLGGQVRRSKQP